MKMKAIRVHGAGDVRFEDVAQPSPGPDDVLVRVGAVGICATDVEVYDGTMFYITSGRTKLPFTPGHEWAGHVVACGKNVSEFAEGDQVVGECSVGCRSCSACLLGRYHLCLHRTETGLLNRDGGFAESIVFPQFFLHHCQGLPLEEAALVEPTAVALNAIRTCQTTPADHVAVVGVGPIGLLAIQAARAYGARQVLAIDVDIHRLELAKELGADDVIRADQQNVVDQVAAMTNHHMLDVVVEATGKPAAWENIPSIMAPCGRIAMLGLFAGQRCAIDFDPLIINNITLHGCLGGPNLWPEAIGLMKCSKIKLKPLITHRLALSEFAKGIEISRKREDDAVKVIITPPQNT